MENLFWLRYYNLIRSYIDVVDFFYISTRPGFRLPQNTCNWEFPSVDLIYYAGRVFWFSLAWSTALLVLVVCARVKNSSASSVRALCSRHALLNGFVSLRYRKPCKTKTRNTAQAGFRVCRNLSRLAEIYLADSGVCTLEKKYRIFRVVECVFWRMSWLKSKLFSNPLCLFLRNLNSFLTLEYMNYYRTVILKVG